MTGTTNYSPRGRWLKWLGIAAAVVAVLVVAMAVLIVVSFQNFM